MIRKLNEMNEIVIGWENRLPAKILSETTLINQITDLVAGIIFEGGSFRTLYVANGTDTITENNSPIYKSINKSLRELFKLAVTSRCLDLRYIVDTSMCDYTYISNSDLIENSIENGDFRINCANNELPALARYFLWNKDTENISETLFKKLKKIEFAGYCHHENSDDDHTMSFECMLSRNTEPEKGLTGDLMLTMQIMGYDGEKLFWTDDEGSIKSDTVPMLANISGVDASGTFRESLVNNQAAVYGIGLNLSQLIRNVYDLPSIEDILKIESDQERDKALFALTNAKFSKGIILFEEAFDPVIEYAYV